ncbi:sperm axonemal maintenance protein CFAP97D1 [Mantella aurantiaca]
MNTVDYLAFPLMVTNQRQNNTLKKKWDTYHYHCHMVRVKTARAEVDNKPPWIYLHHHVHMKKMQMEQERLNAIERDNQFLMEKISHIMRTRGVVDNWNTTYTRISNSGKQSRAIEKIMTENQALHKRIQECKPNYDHRKWEDEWKETQRYLMKTSSNHAAAGSQGKKYGMKTSS